MDETTDKRWQIRVLSGPTRGCTQILARRLSIGRAADSDIFLGDTNVSRQHAKIVEDDQGRHVLVDLSSSNGTFVDGQIIERQVLEPSTTFCIAGIELVYEPAREPSGMHSMAPVVNGRTLRSTEQLQRCEATTRDYPTAEELEEQARRQAEASASPSPRIAKDTSGRPIIFETPGGDEYGGNLLDDIIEYRSLRAQHLRGGFAEPGIRQQFEQLRGRLQQPPSPDPKISQRAFCRFGCWVAARLRLANGREHACQMRDLGVDGAQLVLEGHQLQPEAIVWLTIELLDGDRSRAVVLAGRVAWTDDEFIGLAFAGAPHRVQGRYAEQPGPVRREHLDTTPAPLARLRLAERH